MTESSVPRIAGLLLGAGGSKRLGRPKQLVEFEGEALIRRAAEALMGAGCSSIVVVLGSEIEGSVKALEGLGAEIVVNDAWKSGMGSSIACGISSIMSAAQQVDAVLISLCDQPLVSADKLRPFVETFSHLKAGIVAAEYDGVAGVPALFSARCFPQLAALRGEKGAREVIRNSPDAIAIPLPEAAIDVDKMEDLEKLPSYASRSPDNQFGPL